MLTGTIIIPVTEGRVTARMNIPRRPTGRTLRLVLAAALVVTAAGPPGVQPAVADGAATWDVPNGTLTGSGATVLNQGHVDIASKLADAVLRTAIKDTTGGGAAIWHEPEQTVLQVLPSARTEVPAADDYKFLGPVGADVWMLPETQDPALLWPGWSTEEIPLAATQGGVEWRLTAALGPGDLAVYQTSAFGRPTVLFNTSDGITGADRFTIPRITHAHGAWAFSAEGVYCLAFERSATLAGGAAVSDQFTTVFAVGRTDVAKIDPSQCFTGSGPDEPEPGSGDPAPGQPDQPEELGEPGEAAPPGGGANDPSGGGGAGNSDPVTPPAQTVSATKCVPSATILSSGHIDYASRIVDGKLQSLIGDGTAGTKVYRQPLSTVLWLKPSAKVTLPAGFGQIGRADSDIWQVPQTQNPNLIWLGWSTESLNAGNASSKVAWSIDSVSGPGLLKVYLSGAFGGVQELVFNNGGSYSIPLGVHAHANWAFSAEGIYRIKMTQTVTLANGQRSSDTETLSIAVGNVDPKTAIQPGSGCGTAAKALFLADQDSPALAAAAQAAAEVAQPADSPADQPGGRPAQREPRPATGADPASVAGRRVQTVPRFLAILGGLLLAGATSTSIAWLRSRRR
ncbi:MAG: TIGR03773 family transporter-associated surface protein [Bifidobacteriaceae bacterium]|jgi:putative ABC transporter-associated repeat protein|nr:TIGR03773 family transporter-associated surface protein [Bifidobacteriaceae bacterium]